MHRLVEKLRIFADQRDWAQFHAPKNLAMALSVEVSELLEHFQWLTSEQSSSLPPDKLDKGEQKYTSARVRGQAKKYTEYER